MACGSMRKAGVIRPRCAKQIEVAVGMGVLQREKGRDLSEVVRHRGKVVHVVVEDRLAQALEPCGARRFVGGGLDQNGKQSCSLVRRTAPLKAPEEMSICSKAGPDALGERDHALGRSHRIGAADCPDLGAGRLQPLDGLGLATPTEGPRAHAGL